MYPPTYLPSARTDSCKQAASSHPNPFIVHPLIISPPPPARSPRPIRSSPRGSLSLSATRDSKLSILSGATFTTPTHPSFSSLRRPIHRVSTRSTLSYRSPSESTHIPHPSASDEFPTGRDNNRTDRGFLQNEERERGEGGGGKGDRIYCCHFLNGFRRIDLRRLHVPSWSRADVTRRQDHFRRVLSFRNELSATPRITFIGICRAFCFRKRKGFFLSRIYSAQQLERSLARRKNCRIKYISFTLSEKDVRRIQAFPIPSYVFLYNFLTIKE